MRTVFVIGSYCARFGRFAERSFQDLASEAYLSALADAGLPDGSAIEQAWFANSGMGAWGQGGIRGHVCFTPLVRQGLLPERVPMVNVECGCATASQAFHGAWKDILSGEQQMALPIGVEKLHSPDKPGCLGEIFNKPFKRRRIEVNFDGAMSPVMAAWCWFASSSVAWACSMRWRMRSPIRAIRSV